MSDLSRILDERMNERIISAINDLDFDQFQDLIGNLLGNIGVKVVSREEEGDAVIFRGEGEEGAFMVMASRLFDHASLSNARRLRSLAMAEGRNPVLITTNELDGDAKRFAEKEGISYADKDKLLLLLRKYELADGLMHEIDQRILAADGDRVLPSVGKFDHYITTAQEHMKKGRFKDALYNLDRALELKPSHDNAWQLRANALLNLGRLEEALESCQRATGIKPSDHTSWYLMGLIRDQMGDFDGEIKAYDTVLRLQPQNRSAMLNKGTALYRLKKLDQALKVYDQMLKMFPNDPMANNNKGIVLKAMGRTAEALDSFGKAMALDRNYINPIINTGIIHSESGQHELAIDDWKRAIQMERRRPELWLSLGLSHRDIGDFESALAAFEQALEIDPGLEEARRQESEIKALLAPPVFVTMEERVEQVRPEAVCPDLPEIMPEDVLAIERSEEEPSVDLAQEEKDRTDALSEESAGPVVIFDQKTSLEVSPEPGPMTIIPESTTLPIKHEEPGPMTIIPESTTLPIKHEEPGPLVEPRLEKTDVAVIEPVQSHLRVTTVPGALTIQIPEEIRVSVPPEPEKKESISAHRRAWLTARLLLLVGELDQAMLVLDRALTEEPDSIDLKRLKVQALQQAGRFESSLPLMREIYMVERDERLLFDIEAISYRFDQKSEGLRILEKIEPGRESFSRELVTMLEKKQWDEIILKASKNGIFASSISRHVHALALMMRGRYREASKQWKEVLEEFPGNAEALNNLGVCMRFMGEFGYEEPIRYLTLATFIDPLYADAHNNIGSVYFAAGSYTEAIRSIQKAISIDRKPDYYLNLGSVQMAMANIEGAKEALTSALQLEEGPEVLFMLAVIAEREGDNRWALKLYEDAIEHKPDFKDAIFNLQRVKLQLKYNSQK
jgi:tetratricopeptide (TPR) repeat protein